MKTKCILILSVCVIVGLLVSCSLEQEASGKPGEQVSRAASSGMPSIEGAFYRVSTSEDHYGYEVFRWNGTEWINAGYDGAIRVDAYLGRGNDRTAMIVNTLNEVHQIVPNFGWIYRGKPGGGSETVVDIGAGEAPFYDNPKLEHDGVFALTVSDKVRLYKLDIWNGVWTVINDQIVPGIENALKPTGDYEPRIDVGFNGTLEGCPVFSNRAGKVWMIYIADDEIELIEYKDFGSVFDIACSGKDKIYLLRNGGSFNNVYVECYDYDTGKLNRVTNPLYEFGGYYGYPARNLAVDRNGLIWVSEINSSSGSWVYYYQSNSNRWYNFYGSLKARDISLPGF